MSMRNKIPPGVGKKAGNPKKTFKRLFGYIFNDYKKEFIIVLIGIILSSLTSVISSSFIQILIDDYITPMLKITNPEYTGLIKAIFTMGIIYIIGVVSVYIYNLMMVKISQGTLKKIRDDMFSHMQKLPVKFFDTHSYGDVMSHYTNDTDTLRQMISQSIPQVISSAFTIISVFFAMLYQSINLTFFVLVFVFIMTRVTKKIAQNSATYFIKQQKSLGKVNGFVEEIINGQKVVKVFCYEDEVEKKFDFMNEELCNNSTEANKFANILMPIMGNLGHLQYVLIAILGGIMASLSFPNLTISGVNVITVGAISSFLLLTRSFTMPITNISQQINSVVMALAGAERIFELLDEKIEEDKGYVKLVNAVIENGVITESKNRTGKWAWKHPHSDGSITYTELLGDVTLDGVDFGYNPNKLILKNVSLYAKPGQKIAFVGATGAGKTTITNLINRFYDIDDGKIRYDGININKITKTDLRKSLGIVLQDTNLFTGTVKENIRYGNLEATDEEIINAAKLANAHDFIQMLPEGYDTIISGDGAGLSQGQRQLISIARAAVADPPVMILDEATSSIDTRTEAIVQKGMDSLMNGRTVFVIAHRLSTIQNSDVIIVLENGEIIERGDHNTLLDLKGKYYQLYTGAFELE